jgi:uncharacterized protein (UPF0332 family)
MTFDQAKAALVQAYRVKSIRALASMDRELAAGDADQVVSRAYYACFYAASAVFVREGRQFLKHTGLRSAIHLHLVKPGRIPADMGRVYEELFTGRSKADYEVETTFNIADAILIPPRARQFVQLMENLLDQHDKP